MKKANIIFFLLLCSTGLLAQSWSTNSGDLYFNAGNVGIGTSTPNHVLSLKTSTVGQDAFNIFNSASNEILTLGTLSNNETILALRNASGTTQMSFRTDTDVFYISGKVGIGRTTPFADLDVLGSIRASTYFRSISGKYTGDDSTNDVYQINPENHKWYINGQNPMTLTNGKLGLGTTAPDNVLSIKTAAVGEDALNIFNSSSNEIFEVGTLGNNETIFSVRNAIGESKFSYRSDTDVLFTSGKVGIGRTTPFADLDVLGSIRASTYFRSISGKYTGDDSTNDLYQINANDHKWFVNGQSPLSLEQDKMTLDGKLGLGTTAPDNVLSIKTAAVGDDALNIFNSSSNEIFEVGTLSNNETIFNVRNALGENKFSYRSDTDVLFTSGKVGIGRTTPFADLDVLGSIRASTYFRSISGKYTGDDSTNDVYQINADNHKWFINGQSRLYLDQDKMTMDGKIIAEEIILEDVNGADFVFEEDYDLRSLEETEAFIKIHKHLPEVPSAAEMAQDGLALKEMNILLLQKVEELTLHLIQQDKEAREMRQNTAALTSQLTKQTEEIEMLKKSINELQKK
ncbi:MAG: hypothetical protein R8G66_14320 [Cytophagales bacterium]|nr:hypothetical protein [Cytophagales bacterium]